MIDKKFIHDMVRRAAVSEFIKNKNFIIAANWKMNKNTSDVVEFLETISEVKWDTKNTLILLPPSPYLYLMRDKLRYSRILYGAQNLHWEKSGAFTGEISTEMARDFGCKYAIVGHSERRNIFFETDEMMCRKVEACINNGIRPILCIGEDLDERKSNKYKEKLERQIVSGLEKVKKEDSDKIIIAYEPIWAIGTGLNASPDQVEETHCYIRNILNSVFGEVNSETVPILYGGSVKSNNVVDIALAQNVSGFLIGGASLKAGDFQEIISMLE